MKKAETWGFFSQIVHNVRTDGLTHMGSAAPYLLVLLTFTAVIHGAFAVYSWRQRATAGAAVFGLINLALAVWLAGYAGELVAATLAAKIVLAQTEYFGIVAIPVLWFLYALDIRGRSNILGRPVKIALWIMPVVTLGMVWTTQWHGLHWRTMELAGPGQLTAVHVTYGFWFWVHSAYSYVLLLIGTILFLVHVSRSSDLYRGQATVLLVAAILPWLANAAYLAGFVSVPGLDPTPFAFSLSALLFGWDVYRYRLLDLMPVARMKALATMVEAVIVVDPQGRIAEINPAARALLGPGVRISDTLNKALPHWPELLAFAGEPGERVAQIPMGEVRMFEARRALLSDGPERASGRLFVIREITQILQAARDLARARDEALEASRMKTQLLAKVSHELRTPLGAIIGYSEMMQSGAYGQLTDRGHAAAQRVIHSANYLSRLVDDLLDQARLEAGRIRLDPRSIDIRMLLGPVLAQTGDQARAAGLAFQHHVDSAVPQEITIDGARLQQITVNLLNNALKYTTAGEVELSVDLTDDTPQRLRLAIRDTGVGIPLEAQTHIFEPFWQADHELTGKRSGYGLGLAIVAELTRLMGGTVSVASETNRGSVFTVCLPLEPDPSREGVPDATA